MQWLEGETLGARIVRSDALADIRPQLARQCGEILAKIHAVDVASSGLDSELSSFTPEQLVHDPAP